MRIVKIEEIAKVLRTGKTPPTKVKEYFEGSINWYTPGDLTETKTLSKSQRTITQLAIEENKATIFEPNTVLIGCIGDIGKVGMANVVCSSNQQLTGVTTSEDCDPHYFYYWVRGNQEYLRSLSNNAVVPILNNKTLKRAKLPLPPLETQRKIAAILDTTDEYRQKTKALIDKYDELAQSLFLEMFGDPVLNTKNWDIKKLGDLGKLDRGKSKHRPRNAPELLGGPYPLIQTGDVANSSGYITDYKSTYSEIGLAQSRMWPSGTLCITIAANIAKTGILTFDACFPDSVVGFIPNQYTNNEYVQSWMSFLQKVIEENAPESAQKNINLKILRNLDVISPPTELQNEFSSRIELIQEQRESVITGLSQSEELFNSLLQRAFRGELV